MRGLVRLDSAASARKLWENSGATAGGCTCFVNVVGNRAEIERKDFRVNWIPWDGTEDHSAYLKRVQLRSKYGLVLGRQLGIRLSADDPTLKSSLVLWRARAIPLHWQPEHIEPLMSCPLTTLSCSPNTGPVMELIGSFAPLGRIAVPSFSELSSGARMMRKSLS